MRQFSFIDIFSDLFESDVHVSGDKLVHLQEHFLTIYTAFGTMHRKLYIQSKSAPEDERVCRPKHVEQIQISQ